jgi:VanZ family protein
LKESPSKISAWVLLLLWAGLIFVLSSIPDLHSGLPTIWDLIFRKIGHMLEFGILTWLAYRARPSFRWAGAFSLFYAITDEYHQTFVFGREGTVRDVIIDAIGIAIAIFLLWKKKTPPDF